MKWVKYNFNTEIFCITSHQRKIRNLSKKEHILDLPRTYYNFHEVEVIFMTSEKITTFDLDPAIVMSLNTIDTIADQIANIDTNTSSIKTTVENHTTYLNTINTNVNTNKSSLSSITTTLGTVHTNAANLNTRLTDTRASNLDTIANSTNGLAAIKTAVNTANTNINTINTTLATVNTNAANINTRLTTTRAGYLDLLANTTYGLNAIKSAVNTINTTVSNINTSVSNNKGLSLLNVTFSITDTVHINNTKTLTLTEAQLAGLKGVIIKNAKLNDSNVTGPIYVPLNVNYTHGTKGWTLYDNGTELFIETTNGGFVLSTEDNSITRGFTGTLVFYYYG